METFSLKKVILKFWPAKVLCVQPNSGPSLRLWLHVTTTSFMCVISAPACHIHSFIHDRFLCVVHGFYWPARDPPHMVFHKVQGWYPSIHRLHVSIWYPLTACAVLGQLYADDVTV